MSGPNVSIPCRPLAVLCLALLPVAWAGALDTPGGDDAVLGTLVRGVLHRASLITSVAGSACVQRVSSPRYRERRAETLEALRKADLASESGNTRRPEAAPIGVENISAQEATWVSFSYDTGARKWHVEAVALTNNGTPDVTCALAARTASRALPPWLFYTSVLREGDTEYAYDRSASTGTVMHRDTDDLDDLHYRNIHYHIVLGLGPCHLDDLREGTGAARYLGPARSGGEKAEYEVSETYRYGSFVQTTRFAVCPEMGFVVTRCEAVSVRQAVAPETDGPKLLRSMRCTPTGFTQVADGIWCPMRVQIDDFDYELGAGMDAWMCSRVYDVLELRLNEPVDIAAPYAFPFDAMVTDISRAGPVSLQPRPTPGTPQLSLQPVEWAPDALRDAPADVPAHVPGAQ